MRRIILLLAVAAMIAAMVVSAGPASAGVTIVGGNTGGSGWNSGGSGWDSGGFYVSNGFGGDIDVDGFDSDGWWGGWDID
jgi:hypothetical protein